MPVILTTQETEIRRIVVQSQRMQIVHETLYRKYSTQKSADGVAQVEEHLLSTCVTLSSNINTTK
jgi:hypothetical protein